MSFLRHGEIYPCDEGAISRPRPRSSPWMSLQLAIPGGLLSSRARFRFTSRSYTAHHQPRPTMLRQRTAKCSLTDCLSRGVQSTFMGLCSQPSTSEVGKEVRGIDDKALQQRFVAQATGAVTDFQDKVQERRCMKSSSRQAEILSSSPNRVSIGSHSWAVS
jgi:hypothetical protein